MTLADANGLLSASGSGVAGSGTTNLSISGSLAEVNADLATLTDTDATTPSDTITINASDSNGGTATPASIGVTVNGLPSIGAPATATVVQNQASAISGISLAESGDTAGESFTVTVSDATGELSATGAGVSGSGATSLSIAGSLAQVNSDLATLADADSDSGFDIITVDASDGLGNTGGAAGDLDSSIQGIFENYTATFQNLDALGQNESSIVTQVNVHSLVHGGDFLGDGQTDFLTNDGSTSTTSAYQIYFSDGSETADVGTPTASLGSVVASGAKTTVAIDVSGNSDGWNYFTQVVPIVAGYTLVSVQRADGSELNPGEFWDTDRTFTDDNPVPVYQNSVNIVDDGQSTVYFATFEQTAPTVVNVATFLANQSSLDQIPGGFAVSDTGANITPALDQLDDANVTSITISDNGTVGASVAQLTGDAQALAKLENADGSFYQLAITDTVDDVQAGLAALVADTSHIASITATGGPVTVSVPTFVADQFTLNKIVGGFAISDAAGQIGQYLDLLNAFPSITSITVSDNAPVSALIYQLTSDVATLAKLKNEDGTSYQLAISDTASNIEAGLATLVADTTDIASITSTSGTVTVSVATFLADKPTLDKIVAGFAISDTAAAMTAALDALSDTSITSITISDNGDIGASVAQLTSAAATLAKLNNENGSAYQLAISDTASDILAGLATLVADASHIASIFAQGPLTLSIADANLLNSDNLKVTGGPVTVAGTAAAVLALTVAQASVYVSEGYAMAVQDAATNIDALTSTQIANLAARHVQSIASLNGSLALTEADAASLETGGISVSVPSGSTAVVSDTAGNLQKLTAAQIAGLAAIGFTGLASTNANVNYSVAQTPAILASRLTVAAAGSHTVTENFANGDYSVFENGSLITQKSVNADAYDIAHFNVSGLGYSSYEDIYSASGAHVAEALDMNDGSGALLLYGNGLTVNSGPGQLSVATGADVFALDPHTAETITASGRTTEVFSYESGFGQSSITGFAATGATHDVLQFPSTVFSNATDLLNNAVQIGANVEITDPSSDTLTLDNVAKTTLSANLNDLRLT